MQKVGLPCLFCAQSSPHPSVVDSDWSEEDLDRNIEKVKRKEKQRKGDEMRWRQEVEIWEKQIFDPNYYPPSPIHNPYQEDEILSSLTP